MIHWKHFRAGLATLILLGSITIAAGLFRSSGDRSSGLTDPIEVLDAEVVGHDYRFQFRYPGQDMMLDTADDRLGMRNLHVPAGAVVRLRLNSRDYIYTLEIPSAEVYEVAVPELTFIVQFVAPQSGTHDVLGSQMCGYDHPELLGKMIVQSEAQFRQSMQELLPIPHQKAAP